MSLNRSVIFLCLLLTGCASYHIRQGNRLYRDLGYSMAITEYQKGLSKKEFPEARINLADCYRRMNDLAHAEEAYAKVVQLPQATAQHKLLYAQILMRQGKYEQAKPYFDQYLAATPNDTAASELRASCDSIGAWKEDSLMYTVQSSSLNSGQSNFSPVWYKEGVVFASDRNSKAKVHEWTGRPFLDLYFAKGTMESGYASPVALSGEVNGMYHEGPAAFNSQGDTIYFTRNNYLKRKVNKSVQEEVDLKIFQAVKKDTSWTTLSEFPYNDKNYSTGHPTLTHDGSRMYFVSDMPGGRGGTDLYMCEKVNGEWGKPVNLGAGINTPYNEMFPSVWNDTVLYFSSEGHMNMGGLDVFKSVNTGSGWSKAGNMGYPLNTSFDDFGIAMNDSGTGGLISSNRNSQNSTQDNIYSFTVNDMRFTLEGIAVEKLSQQPLAGVLVELTNVRTGKKESVLTGDSGTFKFKLDPESVYSVIGSKDSYFTNTEQVSTVGKKQSESMFVKLKLELERIVINKPIVLDNIYYDLDKYNIRADAALELDKLVQVMNDNPAISIELSSHTDSRAEDKYNDVLSQRRAEAAVNYIISKGVSASRIRAKGYGEHQLINRCGNKVKCTEEEHQQNRRTEFKVLSIAPKKST
jgi:peptidoglycan-associated lipoprotein